MIIKTDDYSIDCSNKTLSKLTGTLRLPSPLSYDEPFQSIKDHITAAKDAYTIDLTELKFLNSSGLTALARLIMLARKEDTPLVLVGSEGVPWQMKSLNSLTKLWAKTTVVSG